jgi:Na+/H+ antiporter NhaD/arsenite permease-like protein
VSSAGFSAVTDNIPLAVMLAKVLAGLGTSNDSPLWWAVIFGANLGGNLTPIGSASTVVAVTLMHKYAIPIGFVGFVRKAFVYAIVQLAIAVVYVLYVLPWLW